MADEQTTPQSQPARAPVAPLSWSAHEYEHQEKSPDWFWAVGIIAVALAVTAIIIGNVLFGVVVIIAAAALSLHALRKPHHRSFVLTDKGVQIDDTLYPYTALESFWVEEREQPSKLLLRSRKLLMPLINIPIDEEVDEEEVREFLIEYLDEEELTEPLSQKAMEALGF